MSRLKIKKLSTGVQTFTPPYSEKLCTPNNYITQKIKKEKEKIEFPALKAGNGSTPETTQNPPTFFLGVATEEKSEKAGVGLAFVENAWQKIRLWPKIFPKLQNKNSTLLWKG